MYRLFDLVIDSAIPLPELAECSGRQEDEGGRAAITVRVEPWADSPDPDWFRVETLPDDRERPWCQTARRGDGYLVRYPAHADFDVLPRGDSISVRARPGAGPSSIRHLLLDQVAPKLLAHTRALVVHASGADLGGGAVGFTGASGSGKSTLAAYLGTCGVPVLCDDTLMLRHDAGGWAAIGAYTGVRLRPEETSTLLGGEPLTLSPVADMSAKVRVGGTPITWAAGRPVPLRALVELVPGGANRSPAMPRLHGQDAFRAILHVSCSLDPTDASFLGRQHDQLADLAASIPVFRLEYPASLARLADVHHAILDAIPAG